MTPERWREVTRIYAAVTATAPTARGRALVEACGHDEELRREVESLLAEDDQSVVIDRSVAGPRIPDLVRKGSLIGVFRIEALLDVGGMGEVYRARDTKLNRDVAIKILPPAFANEPDRLARFKREAQILASINHPNIAGIYGFEDSGGVHALVLELVEGDTLADRLSRSAGSQRDSGPGLRSKVQGLKPTAGIPIDEALAIARQIADALEAAHEQGIIHRDLKPANIKVREDGTVKVLDFGLAKITEAGGTGRAGEAGGPGLNTQSPTITTPAMTAAGMILGTAAYMSPEQAKGKPADKRSDIWAFGCVLYEMLTGKRAFVGEDVSETLASVLRSEPDWAALPPNVAPSIDRMLRRCLAKDPRRRIGDAGVLRLEIDESPASPTATAKGVAARFSWQLLVGTFVIGGAAVAAFMLSPGRDAQHVAEFETRVDIVTPETREALSLALSPDGRQLAFAADNNGLSQLWLRDLTTGTVRALDRTANATTPFWSPDGRSLAFFSSGRLLTVDLQAGSPRDIAAAPGGRGGGMWLPDQTIVYAPAGIGPLVRVSATGGPAVAVTHIASGQLGHRAPYALPDQRHFLFYAAGSPDTRGVFLGSVDGSAERRLFDADASGPYLDGHLLFARGGLLFAQPFDASKLEIRGDAFEVAASVLSQPNGFAAVTAASHEIAFRGGLAGDRRQLIWFDRSGKQLTALGEVDVRTNMRGVTLSPDGQRVATSRTFDRLSDLYVFEVSRGIWTRLTTHPSTDGQPVWSPDGSQLAWVSSRRGWPDVYLRAVHPGGDDQLLFASDALKGTTDWTSDGQLIFDATTVNNAPDIFAIDVRTKKVTPVVHSDATEQSGQVSADGRWIAYESNQSGATEVYVRPFLSAGPEVRISTAGGGQARWRANGRELFYLDLMERLTAVPIAFSADGRSIEPGRPTTMFQIHVPGGPIQTGGGHQQYAVSADGQRFLVNTLLSSADDPPITLILNWRAIRPATR